MSAVAPLGTRALLIAAALVLAALAGGCGKKGDPEVPEGRHAEFTYPQVYPAPLTVAPPIPDDLKEQPPPSRRSSTIFNQSRTRTRVYGPLVQ